MDMRLSRHDIDRLLKDPTAETRREVLLRIIDQYTASGESTLAQEDTETVEELFRTILKTADVSMRKLLALGVKQASHLPQDIARLLTADVAEIALPILQYSPVLSDAHLLEIIKNNKSAPYLLAIARRHYLSEPITAALFGKQDAALTSAVLAGVGSQISEDNYHALLDQPKISKKLIQSMVENGSLPLAIMEKLLSQMSPQDKEALNETYEVVFEKKTVKAAIEKKRAEAAADMNKLRATKAQTNNATDV